MIYEHSCIDFWFKLKYGSCIKLALKAALRKLYKYCWFRVDVCSGMFKPIHARLAWTYKHILCSASTAYIVHAST